VLEFLLWIIFFPLVCDIGNYIKFKIKGKEYDESEKTFNSTVFLIILILLIVKGCAR